MGRRFGLRSFRNPRRREKKKNRIYLFLCYIRVGKRRASHLECTLLLNGEGGYAFLPLILFASPPLPSLALSHAERDCGEQHPHYGNWKSMTERLIRMSRLQLSPLSIRRKQQPPAPTAGVMRILIPTDPVHTPIIPYPRYMADLVYNSLLHHSFFNFRVGGGGGGWGGGGNRPGTALKQLRARSRGAPGSMQAIPRHGRQDQSAASR